MQLNFVDQLRSTPYHYMHPSTTFPAEASTQFTSHDGMEGWVILESALAGSWMRAADVRGESVTTLPPAAGVTNCYRWIRSD
jgi:hypothetical protein